jgi:alpha-beta hydrolase superfamily lysophospholipase
MRRSRARSVVAAATSALLLAGLGCGGPGPGEAAADLEGEATGLRFEGLAPVPAREVAPLETFGARDGSELPVRHYPAEAGTTLLLIHGSGYHSTYLAPLASRLAARGAARVYTPDLRGHGQAPERRGDIDYVDQLEDDLADLAAHARERHPGTRIVVGGHSSGGGLVVRFAGGRHGQLAAAYLLLAPYLGHDAPTLRPKAGGWARPRIPVIIALSILNGFGVTGLNGITAITFEMPEEVRDGTETLAYSFRLNTGYAPRDYRKDLAGVQVPVLGLIGAGDEAFFAEKLEPTLSEISNARVAVIPGITHLDLPAAAETEEQVAAWLAAL